MKLRKSLFSITVCISIFMLISGHAFSQLLGYNHSYGKLRNDKKYFLKGLTLSYSHTTPFDVTLNHYFSGYNSTGDLVPERFNNQKKEITPIHFGSIGTYLPMLFTSEKSMLALDLGLEAIGYKGKVYDITAHESLNYEAEFTQLNAGVNIGVSYRYGGMASYAKQDRFSWFAGAGVIPSVALVNYGDIVKHNKFVIVPVFNAGIGLYAGLQWSLTAKYYPMGLGSEITLGSNLPGMDYFPSSSRITMNTEQFFQIGVGINLFSMNWDLYRW